ncbi:carbonic anhydrase [Rhodoferax sp.]|uniref:carbonic anhydrase n=1 Tax=Rhodoferax sp. TaxID=50421 RepID=UPI0025FCDD93|nr:carbonic anhydrase family protein [Rhodoferax sp.]
MTHRTHSVSTRWALALLLCAGGVATAHAEDAPADKPKATGKITLPAKPKPQDPGSKESMAQQVREAIDKANAGEGKKTKKTKGKAADTPTVTITIEAEPKKAGMRAAPAPPPDIAAAHAKAHGLVNPADSKASTRAAAMAATAPGAGTAAGAAAMVHGGEVRWGYEGSTGPQAWAKLSPDFNLCAQGTRQSPIAIDETNTLQGPAEPLQIRYQPSGAMVLNNGRTIQVDVVGDNTLTVRGATYKLYQIVFHHPSEERVNGRAFAMVAHLMHRDVDGQVAVVAVLLDPGQANALINKVWTYMPLDTGDRVRMPAGLLDLNELLPQDMRYYQFMGSLTTPPCAENVLWMVLKQPVQISPEQLRLFSQLYPANARPVQPLNGRVVRDAQ